MTSSEGAPQDSQGHGPWRQARAPMGSPEPTRPLPAAGRAAALFVVSVFGLFLELLLIRWIGTEVRIFAYLQNTVLVVCFLGMGMGCLSCRQPARPLAMLVPLATIVLLLAVPQTRQLLASISERLSVLPDLVIWFQGLRRDPWQTAQDMTIGLLLTLALMVLIWETFVPIGRWLGQLMNEHPRPIAAYSVNLAGSLLGIWLIVALSVFFLPPVAWFVVLLAWVIVFLRQVGGLGPLEVILSIAILAGAHFAGKEPGGIETLWSPYQKLTLKEHPPNQATRARYNILVNNVSYQFITDLSDANLERMGIPKELRGLSQYDIPLRLAPATSRMLIVGAGAGNDAAAGVRGAVPSVTAVEIDPAIIALGRRYHPEAPYDAPSVRVVNEDARSFFTNCAERFDLITFGLLDSHTTPTLTNARLDHYVYTEESFRAARRLLSDEGILVVMFWCQRPYIGDRIAGVLRNVFGAEPIVFTLPMNLFGAGATFFVAGNLPAVRARLAEDRRLSSLLEHARKLDEERGDLAFRPTYTTPPATDDWPYLYLDRPRIPVLHALLAGLMALLLGYARLRDRGTSFLRGWDRAHWHFFFLGAAFLLLEVQNISKAAVAFGSTWWVNAVIISGILAMALIANLIVARAPGFPSVVAGVLLCASCVGLYFVDLAGFASLPFGWRVLAVGGLTALPMLFSGILFARSFARTPRRDAALGANLLGALVGGILQSLTFLIGIQALLLIVASLYAAAIATRTEGGVGAPGAA